IFLPQIAHRFSRSHCNAFSLSITRKSGLPLNHITVYGTGKPANVVRWLRKDGISIIDAPSRIKCSSRLNFCLRGISLPNNLLCFLGKHAVGFRRAVRQRANDVPNHGNGLACSQGTRVPNCDFAFLVGHDSPSFTTTTLILNSPIRLCFRRSSLRTSSTARDVATRRL